MEMIPVEYEKLTKVSKGFSVNLKKFIEKFMESGIDCVMVINDGDYNNENDLQAALRMCVKSNSYYFNNVKVFMLNGCVYLKRKGFDF